MRPPKKAYITSLFQAILLSWLCMACLEEPEPFSSEPTVKVRFFNADSLAKITTAIAEIDTLTKQLNAEKTALTSELSTLNSSLASLNAQIADGRTELEPERDSVSALIEQKLVNQQELNAETTSLATEKAALTKIQATINKGEILLSRMIANGREIVFEDSASVYSLPLNMNADRQAYYFEIAGQVDSLELSYSLKPDVTSKSYIRLLGTDITATENYSFDSVGVFCQSLPEPCTSNETTINVYF